MREIAAREAKNRFGNLLDAAQTAPVRVTRKGRADGVVNKYEKLRGAAWECLTATVDALGCRDPDNDKLLETTLLGEADCLITGDGDFLAMSLFRRMPILSPSACASLREGR